MRLGRAVYRMILLYFEDFSAPLLYYYSRRNTQKSLEREDFDTEDIGAKGR